jgi:adenylate kinase
MNREHGEKKYLSPSAEVIRRPEGHLHRRMVFVTGVSGVGKDHIIQTMQSHFPAPDHVLSLHGGQILSRSREIEHESVNRQPIEHIAADHDHLLGSLDPTVPTIFNGHMLINRGGLYIYNPSFYLSLNPSYFITLIGDPQRIIGNRVKDTEGSTSMRHTDDAESIEEQQGMLLNIVDRLSKKHKSGMAVLYMNYGDHMQTVANALFLRSIVQEIL